MTKFTLKMTEITIIGELINIELTQKDHTRIFIKKLEKLAKEKTKSLKKQLASEQQQVLTLKDELAYMEHKLKRKNKHMGGGWRHQPMCLTASRDFVRNLSWVTKEFYSDWRDTEGSPSEISE